MVWFRGGTLESTAKSGFVEQKPCYSFGHRLWLLFCVTTTELSSCDRDQITWKHNVFTIRTFIGNVCGVTQARQLLMLNGKDSGFKTVNRSEPSEDLGKFFKNSQIWHWGEETKNICIWLQSSIHSGWAAITSLLKNGSLGPLGVKLTLNKSHTHTGCSNLYMQGNRAWKAKHNQLAQFCK